MDDPDTLQDGGDPELDRELEAWTQWLLDVYLWNLEEERRKQREDRPEEKP